MTMCIMHKSSCDICRRYSAHFNDAAMEDERSFRRALERRSKAASASMREELEDTLDEANRYCAQVRELEQDLEELQGWYDALE